jgi:hypothetical protein
MDINKSGEIRRPDFVHITSNWMINKIWRFSVVHIASNCSIKIMAKYVDLILYIQQAIGVLIKSGGFL